MIFACLLSHSSLIYFFNIHSNVLCRFSHLKMPVVMASKFYFNALKRLITALRNSMAMGQVVRFDSWMTIQVPWIASHNCCSVYLKQWKEFRRCLQHPGLTEAKEFSIFCLIYYHDHRSYNQVE